MKSRSYLSLVGALAIVGCGSAGSASDPSDTSTASPSAANANANGTNNANGAPPASGTGAAPAAPVSGSFGGSYSVPVSADLAAAATFDVTELTWTVTGGVATLAYNLPRALVGKAMRVVFTGPFDASTGHATLTGAPGTAECTVTALAISCTEQMNGLLPIAPNLVVVEKLAATYAGPAADRLAVAARFAGDPIGIATLDLTRPGVPEPVEPVEPEAEPKH